MLSLKMFLLEMAPHVPSSGTGWGKRRGKDPPPPHVLGLFSCWHHKVASLVRDSCSINISGSSMGVPGVSWDGLLVQDEEASDREQRRRGKNRNENQAKAAKATRSGMKYSWSHPCWKTGVEVLGRLRKPRSGFLLSRHQCSASRVWGSG